MSSNEKTLPESGSPDQPTTQKHDAVAADEMATTVKYDQGWLSSFTRPLLIVILATCLNVALITVVQRFVPSLSPLYRVLVMALGILAAVVGCVTTTWLAQPAQRSRRSMGYRFAELGLLLVLTRLVVWGIQGSFPPIGTLFTKPLTSLFDGPFILAAIVVTISWVVATELSGSLLAMALQPDEIKAVESGTLYRDTVVQNYTDRGAMINGFATQWVIGGLVLIVLAAGANVGYTSSGFLAIVRQNIDPLVITAIVIYFLVGLMLLSHGQLAILRARWALEQTPTRATILRYWPAYATISLLVIGAVAALMPLGGTYWLARLLSLILGAGYFVVIFFFQLFGLLFALLMSLLPFQESVEAPPPPAIQPMMPPPPEAAPSEFFELAGSTVFWLLALLVLTYAAYVYFTDKGIRFTWLTYIWTLLRSQWRQMGIAIGLWQRNRINGEERVAGSDSRRRRRWLPWRRRPSEPNALARFYYHAMLDEAQSKGIVRQQAETPLSFAPRLNQALTKDADADDAVSGLTETFLGVRYGRYEVDSQELPLLERYWKQIRKALRA